MPAVPELEYLLSNKYDPADDSPPKFLQRYNELLEHRNSLNKQCRDKEQTRASIKQAQGQSSATAPDIHGNRYSQLSDNADGSTVSPKSKPKISAGLKQEQLEKLPVSERKAEVDILRREIWALRAEKKRNRHGVPVAQRVEEAETMEQDEEEASMGETRGEEARMEDNGEMGEEELWTTVKRSRER